jgi:hypothetical protein
LSGLVLFYRGLPHLFLQYLVLFFAGTSFFATVLYVIVAARQPLKNTFCVNNAVPRRQQDGPSICVAQSVLVMYCGLACCLSWLMQALDLFFKLVLNWKSYDHFYYHLFAVFVPPLIPVIYTASKGACGVCTCVLYIVSYVLCVHHTP